MAAGDLYRKRFADLGTRPINQQPAFDNGRELLSNRDSTARPMVLSGWFVFAGGKHSGCRTAIVHSVRLVREFPGCLFFSRARLVYVAGISSQDAGRWCRSVLFGAGA